MLVAADPANGMKRSNARVVMLGLALALAGTAARGAESGERADLVLTGAAVDRLLATLVPVERRLPGDRAAHIRALDATFTEARYCGAAGPERGRVVAVVRAGAGARGTPLLAGDADCRAKLVDIAARGRADAGAADAPGAVVELLAAWKAGEVRVALGEIAAGRDAGALADALARAKTAGPIATLATTNLDVATVRGAAQPFDLTGSFPAAGGVAVTAVPPAAARAAAPADVAAPAGGADSALAGSYPLANRLLALFGQDGPWVIDVGGTQVEVRGLQVAGGDGRLAVTGRATSRELQETVRLTIDAAGADLAVAGVRAEPELEDCDAQSAFAAVGCRAHNAARAAGASAAAAAIAERYRGRPLRSLAAPPATSIHLAGRRITVRLAPTRIRATAGGIIVDAKIDLDAR
jgi:hypothetical protein